MDGLAPISDDHEILMNKAGGVHFIDSHDHEEFTIFQCLLNPADVSWDNPCCHKEAFGIRDVRDELILR